MEVKRYTGRVYKIVCSCGCDKIYIGSTTQILCKRMTAHRTNLKQGRKNYQIYQHMREVGIDKFKILLLELFPDITKEELRAKEHEYIVQYDAVKNGLNGKYENPRCEHGLRRTRCVDCKGGSICIHGRQKYQCRECDNATGICPHGRQRSSCKNCRGSQICPHRKRKIVCKECSPVFCNACQKTYSENSYKNHCRTKKHMENLNK